MSDVRAELIITAKDEASANLSKIGQAGKSAGSDLDKGMSGAIQSFTGVNLASFTTAGAMIAVGAGLKYAIDQAAEAERVMTQTEAVIKSTGGAAGLTAAEVAGFAGKLSQLNAIDDEVIQSAGNLMLTFKSISKDVFPQAQQAAIDMSVALNTDLKGATLQVSKALEDPVRGINALRRAGVSFTAEQRNMIASLVETGDKAAAQAIIIEELNSQFGGSGAAAAQTYSGQMGLLKINMDNVAQSIGEKLLPGLTSAADAMNTLVTWNDNVSAALAAHDAAIVGTSATYADYVAEIQRAHAVSGEMVDATGKVTTTMFDFTKGMYVTTTAQVAMTEAVFESSAELAKYGPMVDESARATARLTVGTDAHTTATGMSDAAVNAYTARLEGLAGTYETATEAAARQQKAADLLSFSMGELTSATLFNLAAQNLSAEGALALAQKMGLVDEGALAAGQGILGFAEDVKAGTMSEDEMIAKTAALDMIIRSLPDGKQFTMEYRTIYYEEWNTENNPGGLDNKKQGGAIDGNASGGQVFGGVPVVVGDAGRPELFVPQSSGYVFPTTAGAGGGNGADMSAFLVGLQFTLQAQTRDLARAVRDGIQMSK